MIVSPGNGLFGVRDGMGGHTAGKVASLIASTTLEEQLEIPCPQPAEALRPAIVKTNKHILRDQDNYPEYSNTATTISALWIGPAGSAGG